MGGQIKLKTMDNLGWKLLGVPTKINRFTFQEVNEMKQAAKWTEKWFILKHINVWASQSPFSDLQ